MKETVQEAAKEMCEAWGMEDNHGYSVKDTFQVGFVQGSNWRADQSPWISVADEEPPEYKDVLLSAGSRPDIFVGYFNGKDFRCRSTGDEIEYFRVLHWCPIPE